MKSLIILFLILAWSDFGQANPFVFSGTEPHSENPTIDSELLHAYEFVTGLIKDPIDRSICPIHLGFKEVDGNLGRAIFRRTDQRCDMEEIDLNPSLKDSW